MDGEPQNSESLVLPARSPSPIPEGVATLGIGATVLGTMLLVYWWRSRTLARVGARKAAMDERVMRDGPPTAAAEAHALAKDLGELGERIASDLDARAGRLEALIETAERRIAALEQLQARAVEVKPVPQSASAFNDPQFGEIYELADRGLSTLEIAKRTQRPTGQVELILNLRRGAVAL